MRSMVNIYIYIYILYVIVPIHEEQDEYLRS